MSSRARLSIALVVVGGIAVYGLVASHDSGRWAIVASALATVLLAAYTARLYGAAVSQLRASMRPLLVEVKPYAPPPADLSGFWDAKTGRHVYMLRFPGDDDFEAEDWDGRRPYVRDTPGGPLRVSVVLRNVGAGLALMDEGAIIVRRGERSLPIKEALIRYPRLPAGESTRVNIVTASGGELTDPAAKMISVELSYSDLSGEFRETARVALEQRRSRARTANPCGYAWAVSGISYKASAPET
ncbi:MAG: hypothetical protein WAU77_00845 [Solirubrobacteraceae bacterium]